MSSKKDVKQIKIELKGELKSLVENESAEEFRTCTQQIYYILNKYYKEGFGTQNVKCGTEDELLGTNSEHKELLDSNDAELSPSSPDNARNANYYDEDSYNDEPESYMIDPTALEF